VLRRVSRLDIPLDSGDFCLMDRKVVAALRALPETNRFVRGLRTFVGFKQTGLVYERASRQAGTTKYSFRALCRLALDGLLGFSDVPLKLVGYTGLAILTLTGLLAAASGAAWLGGEAVAGWWLTILVVLGCTGVNVAALGIFGEYLLRIFWEIKGRPTYIVGNVLRASVEPTITLTNAA
jgi:hypothetical protein